MNPAIEECDRLLARSDDDTYEEQCEVQEDLQTLARKILVKLSNPKLHFATEWWEGCHCHGSTHRKSFESHSIEDMARKLAGCEHADAGTLDRVVWELSLTGEEQDQLRETYDRHVEHNKEIQRLTDWRGALKKHLAKADVEIPAERSELDSLRPDLTPEAIVKREEAIAKKVSGRGKIAGSGRDRGQARGPLEPDAVTRRSPGSCWQFRLPRLSVRGE